MPATRLAERFHREFGHSGDAAPTAPHGRNAYRIVAYGMFGLYVFGAIGVYLWRGIAFKPDSWALLLLLGALVLGKVGPFLRDWIPFVLLIFGYEFLRGVAGELVTGGRRVGDRERSDLPNVHLESLIEFDKTLFFGYEPVSRLQSWLYTPGNPQWWDYTALVVYSLHFVLPCLFAFLLWLTARERFWQFTLAFCFMTYTAFFFFLFFPAAPPWLANSWGVVDGIGWPAGSVVANIGVEPIREFDTVSLWQNASPHPVAAMPSLHAAFPWLVLLFAVRQFGWKGLLALPYNAALWFSVVYLANHWVVDILAGIAWGSLAFVVTEWAWRWLQRLSTADLPGWMVESGRFIREALVEPVARVLGPVWNAPGRARAWLWARLTSAARGR